MKNSYFNRITVHWLLIAGLLVATHLTGLAPAWANRVYAQELLERRVTLKLESKPVRTILTAIEQQTSVRFMYNANRIHAGRRISLMAANETLGGVLNRLFTNLQISYEVAGQQIILTPSGPVSPAPETNMNRSAALRLIKGQVLDASNQTALPGANVVIKGGTKGSTTDAEGQFTLSVPDSSRILVISCIGYVSQELILDNRSEYTVSLTPDIKSLSEVVVVGYGTTSVRKNTASVSKVETTKLENLPLTSIGDGLAGRAPGLIVSSSGAGPGKKPTISIRGGGTPLYVIDGVISNEFDFNNINPGDIENFQVLKDAAATAVYGTRGGNGVVLVTTKKGTVGDAVVRYDFNHDWSQPTYLPQKLSSYQRALLANEAKINDGLTPDYSEDVLQKYRDQSDPVNYPNTDWQALALKKFAPQAKHNFSVSGGTSKTQYFASLGYFDQGTLYTQNTNWLKRYNYRINVSNHFDKIGLKAEANLSGAIEQIRQPASQYGSGYYYLWGHIQNRSPMEAAFNDQGKYSINGDHPLVEMDPNSGYSRSSNKFANGNLILDWAVPGINGLSLKAIGNYRIGNLWGKTWTQTAPQYANGSATPAIANKPSLSTSAEDNWSYSLQGHITYDKVIHSDHTVGAALIYEESYTYGESFGATRRNYQLPVDQLAAGPTENMENTGTAYESARAGFVGRLRYDYKGRYMLEGNFRYDGNDNFPAGKRWGFFPSVSAGWVISDESFFQILKGNRIFDYLKFRGSFGTVAQDAGIARYAYLPGYSLNQRVYMVGGALVAGFSEGPLVSTDITWYSQRSSNLGLDFGLLNSKLRGTFDYFYIRTTGYLASPSGTRYTDPLGTSLPTVKTNGAQRRAGWEGSLSYQSTIGRLKYTIGGNLTRYDQLWEVNPNEDEATVKNPKTRTTHEVDYWGRGYISEGFYQNADEILTSPKRVSSVNLAPGDIRYRDVNGDGQLDAEDQVRIGKQGFPHLMYGFNIDLQFKGWFLNSLFQGSGNRSVYLGDVIRGSASPVHDYQLDYWTSNNTNALYPRLLSSSGINGNNNYATSTFWLQNGRYFRLKTLQVGYDLKSSLLSNWKFVRTFRVTLTGQNLLTVSPLSRFYMDPETGSDNNYDYPIQRLYSLGINLAF